MSKQGFYLQLRGHIGGRPGNWTATMFDISTGKRTNMGRARHLKSLGMCHDVLMSLRNYYWTRVKPKQ